MKNNKIIKARIVSRERKKQAEQWKKKQKKNGERERQRTQESYEKTDKENQCEIK